jgi:hypothetical protein
MSTPEPASFGTGTTRAMFAALFGELALYPTRHDPARQQDAFSLFYRRSMDLGLLTDQRLGRSGLWGMNDAAAGEAAGPPPRIAWFHVTLTGSGVPVVPFLAVADAVIARLGKLRLDAVQIVLPVRSKGDHSKFDDSWFADLDAARRVPVRVTLDSADAAITTAAGAIMRDQAYLYPYQDAFRCDALSLADEDHLVLRPIPFEQPGDAHHRVTFTGTLAEWSLDALAFLAAFLNDLAAHSGVTAPLVFNAASEGSGKR